MSDVVFKPALFIQNLQPVEPEILDVPDDQLERAVKMYKLVDSYWNSSSIDFDSFTAEDIEIAQKHLGDWNDEDLVDFYYDRNDDLSVLSKIQPKACIADEDDFI